MITASAWSQVAPGLPGVARMSWMYAGGGNFIDTNNPGNPAAFLRTLEDGSGLETPDGSRQNPGLPSLRAGMRVLFLWYYGAGLYGHVLDRGLPWADHGAEAIRQHFTTLLSLLRDDDCPIDAVIIDNEEWGQFTTFSPNYAYVRPRIIADPRGGAFGAGADDGDQQWNAAAANNHAALLNRCIRDPLAQIYPAATLAGYDGYAMSPVHAVADANGYVLPVSSVVGAFSAPVCYGANVSPFPRTRLGAIQQDINFARAIKRTSPARLVPFITPGSNMLDTVRHLATMGVDRFIYFNPAGGDGSELQPVLDEVNARLSNASSYAADLSRIDRNAGSLASAVTQRDGSILRYTTGYDGDGSWDITFPDPPPGGGGGGGGNGSPPTPGRKLQSKLVDGVRRLVKTAAGFLAAGCNCCAAGGDRCLEVYRTTECYTPRGCEAAPMGYVCADLVDRLFAENHRACVIRETGGNAIDRCYTVDRSRRYNRLTLPRERTVDGRLEQPEVLGNRNNGTVPIRCVSACNDPACVQTDPAPPNGGERTFLRAIPCDPTITTAYWVDATTVRPGCKVVPLEGPGGLCGTIRCTDLPTPESQIDPNNRVLLGVDPLAPAYSSCCECQFIRCGDGSAGGGAAVCPQPFLVPCGGPGQPAGLQCCCGALIGPGATLRYFRRLQSAFNEPGGSTLTIDSTWSGSCTLQEDGSLVGLIHFRQVLTDSTNPDPIITEGDFQSPPVCPMYPNVLGVSGWQADAQQCLDHGGTVNTSQSCTQLYLLCNFSGGVGDPSGEYLKSLRDNIVCTLIPRPNPGCVGGCGGSAPASVPTSLPAGVPDDGGPIVPLPIGPGSAIPALPMDDLP